MNSIIDEEIDLESLHCGSPALTLANAFLQMMGTSEEEIEHTQSTILMAGEHLAETTGPGTWDKFQVAQFFGKVNFMSEHEKLGIGLVLIGFFGWMTMGELVSDDAALEIISGIVDCAPPSEILTQLYAQTVDMIKDSQGM